MLHGKRILLGVCGGIAAYKSVYLLRSLVKAGAEVKVIMTKGATSFVGPLTFSALSKNPVGIDFFNPETGEWFNHVDAGLWPDLIIIAPATANTIGKMVHGICDNLLTAVYLSAKCPVMIAPAMDLDMWKHFSTQSNIEKLKSTGHSIIEPGIGELASGLTGPGRMAEPEIIFQEIHNYFLKQILPDFTGKKILITAGPTYEKIDPVRFIGNHSTGKMGFALAGILKAAGAKVTVVHGPVNPSELIPDIEKISTTSAAEMYSACRNLLPAIDIFIGAAAVADFTPQSPADSKIKKTETDNGMQLTLVKTNDILKELSGMRKPHQIVVGFALETDNAVANAQKKLSEKNLDMIVLNTLEDSGAGFGHNTNKITIIDRYNNISTFELKSKSEAAIDIANHLSKIMYA